MYYQPNPYAYYGYHQNNMTRNHHGYDQVFAEELLTGLKREASAMELYHRLASEAPDENHKNDMLHALQNKQMNVNQLTNLYYSLTGRQPILETDNIRFHTYREGLEKALQLEVEGYESYRQSSSLSQHPVVRQVFLQAYTADRENALRVEYLNNLMIKDYGSQPFVINIEEATKQNETFRTALWTGTHLQVTLMSIAVGEDIGLEVHPYLDQFLRIEQGQGVVQMGDSRDRLDFQEEVYDDFAIVIPAGKYHNLINTGTEPIKLYSIYAPPQHPFGTVHVTKEIAMAAEEHHHH